MKRLLTYIALIISFLVSNQTVFAQGEFAGARPRTLIGKTYNNDRILPGLPGYEYREVTLASGEKDPEQFSVGVFQKGSTWLVFYSVNNTPGSDHYTILDVLVIKHISKGQTVKTLLCRQDKLSDIEVVAITNPGSSEFSPAIKAWRFNRSTKKFEMKDVKGVDCMNDKEE